MKVLWVLVLLVAEVTNKRSGPYRSVLESIVRCQNTTYPLATDPTIVINFGALSAGSARQQLLNGNITIVKDTKQAKLKIKRFAWENGKWKMTYLMNVGSCNGLLLDMFCRTVSLNMYDAKRCLLLKGTYSFQGFDINLVQHMVWRSGMEYGRVLWRNEFTVGLTSQQCFDLETVVERA